MENQEILILEEIKNQKENPTPKMKKTKGTIINWEKGRTSIKIAEFEELCNLYKISKDYIRNL